MIFGAVGGSAEVEGDMVGFGFAYVEEIEPLMAVVVIYITF